MRKPNHRWNLDLEKARLSTAFPELVMALHSDGSGIVTGRLRVAGDIGYTVQLFVPKEYPAREPILICKPDEVPWKIDRHVYEKNGVACLCSRSETRIHWPWGSDITVFLTKLIHPFFIGQFYYDTHGSWPPTGERSHGKEGILETFRELLSDLGSPSETQIERFLQLLARKNEPKGHESCPCGSGKRLRDCHGDLMLQLRSCIDPRHAALDLKEAFWSKAGSNSAV
jgi:hypothetical protein